jgi:tetratricopeptide (TPR) repeat protein
VSQNQTQKQLTLNDTNKSQVEIQLQKILASAHFKSAKKMQLFLEYIVHKTLADEVKFLKQYTIAVEALGFEEDFDADTNPAVRIMAGRVRERLDKYYSDTGIDDNIVISMPKGSYAPRFDEKVNNTAQEVTTQAQLIKTHDSPSLIKRPIFWLLVASLFVFSAIAIKLWVPKQPENRVSSNQLSSYETPFVDVMPFENLTHDMSNNALVKGIRYQLISDLSQFSMIRVRDVKLKKSRSHIDRKHADYLLNGALINTGKFIKTTLILSSTSIDEVIWSKEISVLATDKGFDQLIYDGVKSVVAKMTSPVGMMHLGAMKRLRSRLEQDNTSSTSSYECIVLFYAYDLSKEINDKKAAKKCLKEATDQNITNSTIWAAHGLMLYFDWINRKDKENDTLYLESIKALKKAIKLDPLNALAHQYYGSTIMAKSRNEEAMKSYNIAIKLNPSNPEPHILVGWTKIQQGEWETGIKKVHEGIAMSYITPGWFRIPLAVDAFRREDFEESLKQAEEVYSSGDKRGIILSLAAAIKLKRVALVEHYSKEFVKHRNGDVSDPLRVISNIFKIPKVLEQYVETVKSVLKP